MAEGFAQMDDIIQSDLSAFPFNPPPTPAEVKEEKAKQKEKKKRGRPSKKVTAADEKAARELNKEAEEKATAKDRLDCIRRINKYLSDDVLRARIDVKPPSDAQMQKMSLEELLAVESTVTADLAQYGADEMVTALYTEGLCLVQDVLPYWNPLGLQLSGPVADLKGSLRHPATQSQLAPMLRELSIKYGWLLASGPEKRLFFFTFRLLTQVHQANVLGQRMRDAGQQVPPDIEQEVNDL